MLLLLLFPFHLSSTEEIQVQYASGGKAYKNNEADYNLTFYYSDSYFQRDSTTKSYSHTTMSLGLALAAFNSNQDTYCYQNIQDLFTTMNFTEPYVNLGFTQATTYYSIGVALAKKSITETVNDVTNTYTLIAVAIRGGGYANEWVSNCDLGETGKHYGFENASIQVQNELKSYITSKQITGKLKIWIAGFSRAAATANLVGAALDDGLSLGDGVTYEKRDVYVYCFETPFTTSPYTDISKYNNIYNVINPVDLVTKLPFEGLSFTRYGHIILIPTKISQPDYPSKRDNMKATYDNLPATKSNPYFIDNFAPFGTSIIRFIKKWIFRKDPDQEHNLATYAKDLADVAAKVIGNRETFVKNYQDHAKNIALLLTRGTSENVFQVFSSIYKVTLKKHLTVKKPNIAKIANAITDFFTTDESQTIANSISSLLRTLGIGILRNQPTLLLSIPKIHSGGYIQAAHFPELCYSWLTTYDPNYQSSSHSNLLMNATIRPALFTSAEEVIADYRKIILSPDLDISIYNSSDNLLGRVINGIVSNDDPATAIVYGLDDDDQPFAFLPSEASYYITFTRSDLDEETSDSYCIVNEYSFATEKVVNAIRWSNLSVSDTTTFKLTLPQTATTEAVRYNSDETYTLVNDQDQTITPTSNTTFTDAEATLVDIDVKTEDDNKGEVAGGGVRPVGSTAFLTAYPLEKYAFTGWYNGDNLYSEDESLILPVTSSLTLTAHFKDINKSSSSFSTWGFTKLTLFFMIVAAVLLLVVVLGALVICFCCK